MWCILRETQPPPSLLPSPPPANGNQSDFFFASFLFRMERGVLEMKGGGGGFSFFLLEEWLVLAVDERKMRAKSINFLSGEQRRRRLTD